MTRVLILLLVVSLGANAVLLAKRFLEPPVAAASAGSTEAEVTPVPPSAAMESAAAAAVGTSAAPAWRAIESRDPRTLVANLRAVGFDEFDVHAVIRGIQLEQYANRRAALLTSVGPRPYWLQQRGDGLSAGQRAELRDLARAQEAELLALLGEPPLSATEDRANIATYGPLPAGKIRAIKRIQADYSDLASDVMRERASGPMMPWDREKLAFIETERRRDLEAALTPEEMEIYRCHGPGIASTMRRELAGFDPTEAEFRAVHAIRSELDTGSGATMVFDATTAQQRSEAVQQSRKQIQALLGDERYALYERVTDWGYRNASEIVARHKLPAENATAVYELARDYQARATELRNDRSRSGPERREAAGALAREARARLTALLTPGGVSTYTHSAGYWLRNLESQGGVR